MECDELEEQRRGVNIPGFHKTNPKKNGRKNHSEQTEELNQIRNMVSQFGTSGSNKLEGSTANNGMNPKIKFY